MQEYFPQAVFLKQKNQSYLDSAATTLKLKCAVSALQRFYEKETANVHRGDHYLSDQATLNYENTRTLIQKWIQAEHTDEIIFTKNTTEGLNFLAHSVGRLLKEGDEILLTEMEHHSNLLPWQALAKAKNLKLKFVPVNAEGELELSGLDKLLSEKVKVFSFVYYSNAIGTRSPVEQLCALAKKRGVWTIVDAAQAMTIEPVNVQKMGCDFLVFSGHKLFSPEGAGVLYARKTRLEKLEPYQLGGGMVDDVSLRDSVWAAKPHCFEAGTPAIGSVLALGAVINFLNTQNYFDYAKQKTLALLAMAEEQLKKIKGLKIIGESPTRVNILSFVVEPFHGRDLGQLMSQAGAAVRTGHHCCLPLMKKYGLPSGTVRASFAVYNDEEDVHRLTAAVQKACSLLTTA